MRSYVFDIQRFCLHDGPGIRTTVFLKGCPLDCLWCHNPESKRREPQLAFDLKACIGCGDCLTACDCGAITDVGVIEREKCTLCAECVSACTGALRVIGETADAEKIINTVLSDRAFYESSGGGMTLSGGEPLYSGELALRLLRMAKEQGIHTCLETSGFAPTEQILKIAPYVDLFLYDIKETNSSLHKKFTGVDNSLILENLRSIDSVGAKIILRCPVIPGYNDREDHFKAVGELAEEHSGVFGVEILPYHSLGRAKADSVGKDYPLDIAAPTNDEIDAWIASISRFTHKKANKT